MTACSSIPIERERSINIQSGMGKQDVVDIMGLPKNIQKWNTEHHYIWNDIVVIFENDKVVSKASNELHARYAIQTEAYHITTPEKRIAIILPSVKGLTKDDLEFLAIKPIIENILDSNFYQITEDESIADTIVFVNFGVSDPKSVTQTWSEPVYEYITPKSPQPTTTTHNVYNSYGQNLGQVESTTTQGNPYQVNLPQAVYRGERIQSKTTTSYTRHLIIEATDYKEFKASGRIRNYWKVITTSEGESNDIRKVLPFMGVITRQIVETDTGGKVNRSIYANDPRAKNLNRTNRVPANKR